MFILDIIVLIKMQQHYKYTEFPYIKSISPPLGGLGGKKEREYWGVGGQKRKRV
jgi:hypothetical protein